MSQDKLHMILLLALDEFCWKNVLISIFLFDDYANTVDGWGKKKSNAEYVLYKLIYGNIEQLLALREVNIKILR